MQLLEAREDVGRKDAADDISQVRHIVDVGKSGGDEDVVFVFAGEAGVCLQDDLLRVELFAILFGYFNFLLLFHLPLAFGCLLALRLLKGGLFFCLFFFL